MWRGMNQAFLSFEFASIVWKRLAGVTLTIEDLKEIDELAAIRIEVSASDDVISHLHVSSTALQ